MNVVANQVVDQRLLHQTKPLPEPAHEPLPEPTVIPPHAVSRLRAARLARSSKPFLARGGPRGERCAGCRLNPTHCLCGLRPSLQMSVGVCLIMADIEPIKPSNTGWLIADMVADTLAFGWARTEADTALLALLRDEQWQPYVVFPAEFAANQRVVTTVQTAIQTSGESPKKRPLFVLLDGTWPEARKMFRKSPYLDHLPVLSLQSDEASNYQLRRSQRAAHFCTSEVAAMCLALSGQPHAAQLLDAYLDVFTNHYLHAKQQLPLDYGDAAHVRLQALRQTGRAEPEAAAVPAPLLVG